MLTSVSEISKATTANATLNKDKGTIGKDDFLKLLIMQLRTQNPIKPMDNIEFATQLAQFSQLEQLANIRSILENQNSIFEALTQSLQSSSLANVIGGSARAYSNRIYFDGDNPVKIGFKLDTNVIEGELLIKDQSGRVIRTIKLEGENLESGMHWIEWNGKDATNNNVPIGEYSFQVVVKNSAGSTFTAETFVEGRIQAIRFKPEGTVVVINNVEIPLKNLIEISEKV